MSETEQVQPSLPAGLLSLVLRSASVGGKLVLVLYLGKFLSLHDLGVYGLTTTTVLVVVYVIGFDFYTYCARELLAAPPSTRRRLLRDQLVCHALGYGMLVPALSVIFATGFLPWSIVGTFYWILVGTHLCQEIHRVLITLSRPVAAYAISAVAHGLWPFPVVLLGVLYPELRTLNVILVAWAISGTFGAALGVFWLHQLDALPCSRERIDWMWIRRGMTVSYRFFLASLLYRSIELLNRYFLHHFWDDSRVGVYTLYASIANTAHDLTFTAVAAPLFGPLVSSFQSGEYAQFSRQLERLRRGVVRSSLILFPAFVAGMHVLAAILAKPLLREELPAYYLLLAGAVLLNLSLVPQYQLYARRTDGPILLAAAVAAIVDVASNVLLVPTYGVRGAGFATLVAMAGLYTTKYLSAVNASESRSSSKFRSR
jgi:O-antigen/teichoic acid export membrane protein